MSHKVEFLRNISHNWQRERKEEKRKKKEEKKEKGWAVP
jgi:hypothetical protein